MMNEFVKLSLLGEKNKKKVYFVTSNHPEKFVEHLIEFKCSNDHLIKLHTYSDKNKKRIMDTFSEVKNCDKCFYLINKIKKVHDAENNEPKSAKESSKL